MRILVLGGTSFVGRAVVQEALDSGAEVTLFNRGRSGADLFPDARRRVGDRDTGDYASLRGGDWDAVVDVSAYVARHVGQVMDILGDRVGRYVFISSHAVYVQDGVAPGSDESTPLREPLHDADVLTNDTYGPCKVACEDEVLARYGQRATIVRPGKVAGPYDSQETFTYWVRRAARGGRVAVPGNPQQPTQIIDARDLAALVMRLVVDERDGAFNAVGPADPTTVGQLIQTCAEVAGTEVEIVPVPMESAPALFPLIRPDSVWSSQQRSAAKARAAGMPATPLAGTAADVLAWDRARGEPPLPRGFTKTEEANLLAGRT